MEKRGRVKAGAREKLEKGGKRKKEEERGDDDGAGRDIG